MAQRFISVFHNKQQLRRRYLEELAWSEQDFRDFCSSLGAEDLDPESLFIDLFSNALTVPNAEAKPRELLWWRERVPAALPLSLRNQAALGYALAQPAGSTCIVELREQELESEDCRDALAVSRGLRGEPKIVWLLWSHSLVAGWQRGEGEEGAELIERLYARFAALKINPLFISATDPLGSVLAARSVLTSNEGVPVVVFPAFGRDRLVRDHWAQKTLARFSAFAESATERAGEI